MKQVCFKRGVIAYTCRPAPVPVQSTRYHVLCPAVAVTRQPSSLVALSPLLPASQNYNFREQSDHKQERHKQSQLVNVL